MGSQENYEDEREFVREEVILEGTLEEGVVITYSEGDDYYEEPSSSSSSEYLPSDVEGLVGEFVEPPLEPEPEAGPSGPDTSRPVAVVHPEGRNVSPVPSSSKGGDPEDFEDMGNPLLESFRGIFNRNDLDILQSWILNTRASLGTEGFVVPHAPVLLAFASFLEVDIGHTWEEVLLSQSVEVHLARLSAYISGWSRMTMFQRLQWERVYQYWTPESRREQLRLLAESGGFLVVE